MQIVEVSDKSSRKQFLMVPKILYRNDKNWICPLDTEIEGVFSKENNSNFKHGDAKRWVLIDKSGTLIGRIAAFYHNQKKNRFNYPAGGAGFFECINKQEAANLLFDTAKEWLKLKGLEAMQAPINFGENYNHWGCLVEGFTSQAYAMPYNFPYYRALFENYGFKIFFEQLSFHKDLQDGFQERMVQFALSTQKRPGYTFEHFNYKNKQKYISDFVATYNSIWSKFHDTYTPLEYSEIEKMVNEARLVIDEELIWFAYDKGYPVGLLVVFPDFNQILAKLKNGSLNLINKIKLFYFRKRAITRSRAFIIGVTPEYQNTGIVAAMFYKMINVLQKRPRQTELELSWIGDYNPRMISTYEKVGGVLTKRHITYMFLFDPKAKFQRFDNQFEGKKYK